MPACKVLAKANERSFGAIRSARTNSLLIQRLFAPVAPVTVVAASDRRPGSTPRTKRPELGCSFQPRSHLKEK